jgi:hypothetical protein
LLNGLFSGHGFWKVSDIHGARLRAGGRLWCTLLAGSGDVGLIVAGGDLLNEMNDEAPEFWILDAHEVFRE